MTREESKPRSAKQVGEEQGFNFSDGDTQENYLRSVFEDLEPGADASGYIRDWSSEYHLSPLRSNLLRGVEIRPEDTVLEVGCGCGAITEYLGQCGARVTALEGSVRRARITASRCRHLERVRVVQGEFGKTEFKDRFSIVTLIGVLEYAPVYFGADPVQQCLAKAQSVLAEDGLLLVAIENRLGLKYFNGCTEDHTNRHWDSIHDAYHRHGPQTWGRSELRKSLEEAGFGHVDFIYPFPDYKLPQALIYPRALEQPGFDHGAVVGQYESRDYVHPYRHLFSERLAWRQLARNGLLGELANSFLVLAWRRQPARARYHSRWLCKSFSAYRRAGYRVENTFLLDSDRITVERRAMSPTGPAGEKGPLRQRRGYREAYHPGETLSAELLRLLYRGGDENEYLTYLGRYYDYLRALPRAGGDANVEGFDEFVGGEYFDCIPNNLVVDPEGDIRFIDREWEFKSPVPLAYVLFRGIVHDLDRVGFYPSLRLFEGYRSLGEFIAAVMRRLDMPPTPAQLEWMVAAERSVQGQVLPAVDPNHIVYRLDAPPGELFKTVQPLEPRLEELYARVRCLEQERAHILSSRSFRVARALMSVLKVVAAPLGRR